MLLDPRPRLTPAIERVLLDLCAAIPELSGLDPAAILVVGLAAHGTAAASVRELSRVARGVSVDGHRRSIELGLRPPFFLDGDASRRLGTLIHELLHIDPADPARLLEDNRHDKKSHTALEKEARALAARYLERSDPAGLLCLAHQGEVLLRQWRRRPFETTRGVRFSDDDVFEGPVIMLTPAGMRGGWW